jgi:hypothetical protein
MLFVGGIHDRLLCHGSPACSIISVCEGHLPEPHVIGCPPGCFEKNHIHTPTVCSHPHNGHISFIVVAPPSSAGIL